MNKIAIELPILYEKDIKNSFNVSSFYYLGKVEKLKIYDSDKIYFVPIDNISSIGENSFNIIPEVSLKLFKENIEEVKKYKNIRIVVRNSLFDDEAIKLIEKLGYSLHLIIDDYNETFRFMEKYGKRDISFHISIKDFNKNGDRGLIFSSFICGTLLYKYNIKTIMLSGKTIVEVYMNSLELLRSLNIDVPGPRIVSCPTCSRADIDLIPLAESITYRTSNLKSKISIAVMGCIVNGPGEARESDVGIAGGKNKGLLFKNGETLHTVESEKMEDSLINLIEEITGEKCLPKKEFKL